MARPYYLFHIVPADKHAAGVITSPSGDYTVAEAEAILPMVGAWYNVALAQGGWKLRFVTGVEISDLTLTEMQAGITPDEHGLGFNGSNLAEIIANTPGLGDAYAADLYRTGLIIGWGGGYAAGLTAAGGDIGIAAVGCSQFNHLLTGVQDDWALAHAPTEIVKSPCKGLSHEIGHSLGVYTHAGDDFGAGEFAVPGLYEDIVGGFSSYPFAAVKRPPTGQDILEAQIYPGAVRQMLEFSRTWLDRAF